MEKREKLKLVKRMLWCKLPVASNKFHSEDGQSGECLEEARPLVFPNRDLVEEDWDLLDREGWARNFLLEKEDVS